MKWITIEVSDQDYEDLVAHYAKTPLNQGRPMVAVHALSAKTYHDMILAIERYRGKHPPR